MGPSIDQLNPILRTKSCFNKGSESETKDHSQEENSLTFPEISKL